MSNGYGKRRRTVLTCAVALLLGTSAAAENRSALLMLGAGDVYYDAKRYSVATGCYLGALVLDPNLHRAHFNLGVIFHQTYRIPELALYHFEQYARSLAGGEQIPEDLAKVLEICRKTSEPTAQEDGTVLAVLEDRLVLAGGDWVGRGEEVKVPDDEGFALSVEVEYVYPDRLLTGRILTHEALEKLLQSPRLMEGRLQLIRFGHGSAGPGKSGEER